MALKHMQAERYGEAIDLLNKVITSKPRIAENYFLRATCFEYRKKYQYAVLDFRRAKHLAVSDKTATAELKKNISEHLNNVIRIWYAQLRKNIDGYKREIAIDPSNPFNYLEIGKAYRWMEEWKKAEIWYDKYLAKDDNASPYEIICYTEILIKIGHIKKGEIVLKKFVKRYPEDWRLWSKYGHFTMWVGNRKNAIKAFETALSFRPYFKEAAEGLDKAKGKYYVRDYQPRSFEKVYKIDYYYRLLKKKPNRYKIRYKLIDELIKEKRIEEAYQQLQILSSAPGDTSLFNKKWDFIISFRDSIYNNNVELAKKRLEETPYDKTTLIQLTQYYEYLNKYEEALQLLENYFNEYPDESNPILLYQYARVTAWIKDFDKALELINKVIQQEPNNLTYQLFKAQLLVWTLQNFEEANSLLNNVLDNQPNNIEAIIALASLRLNEDDFEAAQELANRAKKIDPASTSLQKLLSNIEFKKLRAEEEKNLSILEDGRELFLEGKCKEALQYYENYLNISKPTSMLLKEYADVNFCAENYDKALLLYSDILKDGYDYDVAIQRAKVFYMMNDSINAVYAFKEIVKEEPDDFDARIYLGDSFFKMKAYDSARAVYDTLLTWDLDSSEVALIQLRKKWFPVTGIKAALESFPNYIGFAPSAAFYSDVLGFRYFNAGGRLELGVSKVLAVGASFDRTYIENSTDSRPFSSIKGYLFFNFNKNLRATLGYGKINTPGFKAKNEFQLNAKYEIKNEGGLTVNYLYTFAGAILYSPFLVELNKRFGVHYSKLEGFYYHHPMRLKFSSYYQYMDIEDVKIHNQGNDLQLRVGYIFNKSLIAGYEFFYQNYKYPTKLYYSPSDYESHSAWAEWIIRNSDYFRFTIIGKLGYVLKGSYVLRELAAKSLYHPFDGFSFEALLTLGSTYRDDASYNFVSGRISFYWSL